MWMIEPKRSLGLNLPPDPTDNNEALRKKLRIKLGSGLLRRWPHNSYPSRKYYTMTISRKEELQNSLGH
jgi:hypothetical protein